MTGKIYVAPSILAADLGNLLADIRKVEQAADFLHIDVMDGHFVPNLSFGLPLIQSLRPRTQLAFDVHLMISNPMEYIEAYAEAGADYITIHAETVRDLPKAIAAIRATGKKPGISINPETRTAAILPYLELVDLVLVMSVRPGFGGQSFMPDSLGKISKLRQRMEELAIDPLLSVDGGISLKNSSEVLAAGANMLVAGSSIFGAADPQAAIQALQTWDN